MVGRPAIVELVGTPLHLGPLHPAEQVLTLALAFGPLVLLVVTVWISRRRKSDDSDDTWA